MGFARNRTKTARLPCIFARRSWAERERSSPASGNSAAQRKAGPSIRRRSRSGLADCWDRKVSARSALRAVLGALVFAVALATGAPIWGVWVSGGRQLLRLRLGSSRGRLSLWPSITSGSYGEERNCERGQKQNQGPPTSG